jgi:uncharacterized protein YjgD (DUF1641 family)
MTTVVPDNERTLQDKIDLLTEQVAFLAEEATLARRRREEWDELRQDLRPIAAEAMEYADSNLEELTAEADVAELLSLARQLARSAGTIERSIRVLDSVDELAADLVPVTFQAMTKASSALEAAEEAGYFGFARASMGVVDKVITSFSEEDVDRLGDNVVSILEMVKELTQPEMVALFTRMIEAIERQQEAVENEPDEPPSLWQLAKQVRDPEVRRGMGRALSTLRAVSAETSPSKLASAQKPAKPTQSDNPNDTAEKGAG